MDGTGYELTQEQVEAMVRPIPGDFVVYLLVGRKMKVLHFSDTILFSFGVTAEEFRNATKNDALDVVMPADRDYVLSTVFGKPVGPELIHCQFRLMHRKKGFFWVHSKSRIIGLMDGCTVILTNYLNASAEAESYCRILDDTASAFCTVDVNTKEILYANQAARNLSKVENKNVYAGYPCYEYYFRQGKLCGDCPMARLALGQSSSFERFEEENGHWYSVNFKRVAWLGHDCLEISANDITEIKSRELKERANSLLFTTAAKQLRMSVWEYNLRSGKLLLHNDEEAAEEKGFKEKTVDDFPGSVMKLLTTEADRERFRRMIGEIRSGKEVVNEEFWFKSEDGLSKWCEQVNYFTQADKDGEPVIAYGVGLDVTAQKQEMEKFYQSIERILAMNPNSLCTFQINLTKNECSEGHGVSEYIRSLLQSDTADGLLGNIVSIIPDSEQRRRAAELFDRKKLLLAFRDGKASLSIDYMRKGEDGRPFWVRTYINMLKNPETQDVIGIFYSLDISSEKLQNEIFDTITDEEYDYVALLHAEIDKIEFLNVGSKLVKKYHDAFDKPGVLFDFDAVRRFAADSWIDQADRAYYLRSSGINAVRRKLDRNGHYELSIRGHYTGHPDEFMCRKIQHYYLGKGRDTILIIQSDVTETYLQEQKETQRAKSEIKQLSDILDRLPAGICVLNMPDSEHVYTSFCNQQQYKMLGITPNASTLGEMGRKNDQLVTRYFQDEFSGVHPDDQIRMRDLFRKGYSQDRFTVPNVRLLGGEGKYKHITIELVLRDVRQDEHIFYAVYRDVTEEVALQRELDNQQRKQMERTLVDTIGSLPANYVLYRENSDGALLPERYSDEFCRMKGCTQETIREFNGMNGFAPVHPDDRDALEKAVQAYRGDDQMHHAEYRIRTMNSGYKWVSVNYSFFPVGEQRYLYVVYTDIDELKKQERQLEEQYNTALAFLDSVSGTYLATQRANLTQNLVESISGSDPLNMKNQTTNYDASLRALIANMPRSQDRRDCAETLSRESLIQAFRRGEKSRSMEYMIRMPDRGVNWVRKNIILAKRPESEDIISFAAISDENEEKLTGEIIEQIVSKQFDYVCCINAETERFVLFFSNTSKPELNRVKPGMKYDEMLCEYNRKYVSPGETEKSIAFMRLANVRRALEQTDRIAEIYTCDEGDGLHVVQVEFFWLDRENGLIVLVRTDITEAQRKQVQHEKTLRAALKSAEEANRAKSDFLSRMSHDIRTPLNGIIGMTYLMKKMRLPAEAKEDLSKIDTSSKFLLGLINDVLDMSKAESGKLELHPEPYNEKTFASYLEAVIAPLCREKNIKFVIESETVPGVDMLMDPLRINQVFFNLLSNAVKFTPEGGTVAYRVWEKRIGEKRISITAQVADTGIGMSENFQKVLFDPFTQENRKDISEGRGTGLGLAIVKKVLDAMGGTITVESKINEGTTFTVHADVDCIAAGASEKRREIISSDGEHALSGKHVLLCEDHPLNQEIAVALLTEMGMSISVAEDGKIGAEMFRKSTPDFYDIILMDIRMPVMDGYEATKLIRTMDRADARTVPIIAMTADAFSDDVQKCLNAGMNGHVAKPIAPKLLNQTMIAAIAAAKNRRPST